MPENHHRLPLKNIAQEDGNHAAELIRFLTRSIDMKVAEDRRIQAIKPMEYVHIALTRQLRDSIVGNGTDWMVLIRGKYDRLAINGTCRCMNKLPHLLFPCNFQERER